MKFPRIPQFDRVPGLEETLKQITRVTEKELGERSPDTSTRQEFLLTATDDRSVWRITINGTGTLTTTKVRDA
jgi:hypothetical protein